jgi:hypothetical protein
MSGTVNWSSYEFEVAHPTADWRNVGGVYIFSGLNRQGLWVATYIGETESFRDRVPGHERWAEAARLGATHVHARVVQQAATRERIEEELVRAYRPPLNSHYK